jgi:hypothetical protein
MERGEFKFPSEGRLIFLLIISISLFPHHSNIRRNLSGVAKTTLAGEGSHIFVCSSLDVHEFTYIFNTNLKTFMYSFLRYGPLMSVASRGLNTCQRFSYYA